VIFLDTSLSMWGVPRVFATAVGMALATRCEPNTRVVVCRNAGTEYEQADLSTKAGLLAHLERLSSEAHPAVALGRLRRDLEEQGGPVDYVLITSPPTAASREFWEQLDWPDGDGRFLVVSVARSGECVFARRGSRSLEVLSRCRLNLDDLLFPPAARGPRLIVDGSDLPAIYRTRPFPFLVSPLVPDENLRQCPGTGHVLGTTGDGRVLFWPHDRWRCGAIPLLDNVPCGGPIHFFERTDASRHVACAGSLADHRVQLIRFEHSSPFGTAAASPVDLPDDARHLAWFNHRLVIVGRRIELRDLETGRPEFLDLPEDMRWSHDRFFVRTGEDGGRQIFGLTAAGGATRLAAVSSEPAMEVLDHADGLVSVFPDGWVQVGTRRIELEMCPRQAVVRKVGISQDRRRLLLEYEESLGQGLAIVRLPSAGSKEVEVKYLPPCPRGYDIESAFEPSIHEVSMYPRQFPALDWNEPRKVFRTDGGTLGLAFVDTQRQFIPDARAGQWTFDYCRYDWIDTTTFRRFQRLPAPAGQALRMSRACWGEHGTFLADSQALIHLRAAGHPYELSLLIRPDGQVSGWSTQGLGFGEALLQEPGASVTKVSDAIAFLKSWWERLS
jgi:hypothetical protein